MCFRENITWSFQIMWQTKTISSPPAQCLRPRELLRWWLSWVPAHKVIWPFDHVILPIHVTNLNHYISSTAVSKPTKLSWMVTFVGGLLHLKSHEPLITWSSKITRLTKIPLYPHYRRAYRHQTWQVGDLPWGTPIHVVAWPYTYVAYYITRQTKSVISLLPLNLLIPNLAWWCHAMRRSCS